MANPLLELAGVSLARRPDHVVLRDVSLVIRHGDAVVVRGPSGAGKSTLLRLLCRLEEPTSGQVLFGGRPVAATAPPSFRRQVVYLHQQPAVEAASVRDNLLLPWSFRAGRALPRPSDSDLRRSLEAMLLPDVELGDPAQNLSVGQRQRLCLIRAMLLQPLALLLDEPTSALDAESAACVLDLLGGLHARGQTIVVVSHQSLPTSGSWSVARTLALAGGRLLPEATAP